jgi:hypothetical protein
LGEGGTDMDETNRERQLRDSSSYVILIILLLVVTIFFWKMV